MKILVVTLSNLGDVILTLPVFQSLLKKHPEASLDVIAGPSGAPVFENDPRIRRVQVYDKKADWGSKLAMLRAVRRERYDLIVDLRYSLIGLFGAAAKRNSYLVSLSRRGHRAVKHLEAVTGIAKPEETESFLAGSAERETPPLPGGPVVSAAVGSKSDTKKWPAEKFAALLYRLSVERNCAVVLVGDKNDAADAEQVRRAFERFGGRPLLDLTGKTGFWGLVSVIRRSSLLVTNDSAPLHIADSLKVPVLALFGPSDPKKYGPRHSGVAVSQGLFCQPCERAQCRYGHRDCLEKLEAAEVYPIAVRALEERTRHGDYRILVVRLDRIGDLVLSLPAVEALRRRFPEARISLLTRDSTSGLLSGHPALDEVIAYDYSKRGRHAFPLGYFRFLNEIAKRRFDAAVILHPGTRSYLLPLLAGIPHRIGYRNALGWMLTRALPDERRHGRRHESQYALELVSALTGVREGDPALPKIAGDPLALAHPVEGRWIAVHPGASCASKRWPAERFRAFVETALAEFPEHRVAVVGGEETRADARAIAAGLGDRVADLSGALDLRALPSLLSRCELLVSNDSGPVHVAAAAGTRVISIFGRNRAGLSPLRWRPLGQGHAVIQKEVGCAVCLAHECPIDFECLKAVTVEHVMAEARKILLEPVHA